MNSIFLAIMILGLIGFSFSVILAFLSKKLAVKEDPRVKKIMQILPGLNCGACGYSGCHAYAEAAVKEKSLLKSCLPGGESVNEKIIDVLGLKESKPKLSQFLICQCGASAGQKKKSSIYKGPSSCKAADVVGGALDCIYGCLGFGDCIVACPANALFFHEGRIKIDRNKCISCGKCIEVCPRNLFTFIPRNQTANCYIACSNKDKAQLVKKVCERGCIGCGICTRVPNSPYYLKENISHIEYNEVKDAKPLIEGKNKCPTKCILSIND